MLNVVVVDDEKDARLNTLGIINMHCPNLSVVSTAANVAEGIEAIQKYKPDLVLLDIDMPDGTGFDLLRKLMPIQFAVVFITAYAEHAITAIKFNALDFLVKPLDPEDFLLAVNKAQQNNNENHKIERLENLLDEIENKKKPSIALGTADSVHFVDVEDIVRIESSSNYSTFYLNDGQKVMVSRPLKEYAEMLDTHGFFRPHQSHLINLACLKEYKKRDGGYILLTNGDTVPMSARKKEKLLEAHRKFRSR